MMTLYRVCYLSLLYLFTVVNGSPIEDDNNGSPHTTTEHFLMDKLKEAYYFMFASKTTPKTTISVSNELLSTEDTINYDYTTLESVKRFKSIMNHEYFFNRTHSDKVNARTFNEPKNEDHNVTESFRVTEDPILKLWMKPEDVLKQKAEVEELIEKRKVAKKEAVSAQQYQMPFTRREESLEFSEEYVDPDEGILQKVGRKIPFLKHILPNVNIGDKIMGSLIRNFHKTFIQSAQAVLGNQDVRVGETFKEDVSHKAKEVGLGMKETLGHVKEKVVHGMSKVAGAVGRKIGELFAHYQAQKQANNTRSGD